MLHQKQLLAEENTVFTETMLVLGVSVYVWNHIVIWTQPNAIYMDLLFCSLGLWV